MSKKKLRGQLIGVVLAVLLLTGCGALTPAAEPTATSAPEPTATEFQEPKDKSEVPRISVEDLKERLDNGKAILVVDSRATSVFEVRHIAGAISVPQHEVESRLDEFPHDQDIVFY